MASLSKEDLFGRLKQLELENARIKAQCEISLLEQQLSDAGLDAKRFSDMGRTHVVAPQHDAMPFSSTPLVGIRSDRLREPDFTGSPQEDGAPLRLSRSRSTMVKAATYDGSSSWLDYKAHFDICADINGWSYTERGQYLAVSLRGQAQGVFGNLATRTRDYDALVKALEDRFAPPNQTELLRVQLRERRQRASESLSELGQDIRRLTNLAYPPAPPDLKETLAKEQFVDSLISVVMRLRIKQARPLSLNDAVRYAVELEAFDRGERVKREGQGIISSANTASTDKAVEGNSDIMKRLLDDVDNLERQVKDLQSDRFKSTQRRSGRQRAYFNCGARDHLRDKCPKLVRDKPQNRSPKRDSTSNANSVGSGLFIPVTYNGLTLDCLVDTGATMTVLSSRLWDASSKNTRGKLQPYDETLIVVSGAPLCVMGKASVKLGVNGQTCETNVIVADIENDLMMGLDFMKSHNCSINVSKNTLSIEDKLVRLECKGRIGCYRICPPADEIVRRNSKMYNRGKANGIPKNAKYLNKVSKGISKDTTQLVRSVATGKPTSKKEIASSRTPSTTGGEKMQKKDKAGLVCPNCQASLQTLVDYHYHVETCIMQKEGCGICMRAFKSKRSLLQHTRRKHGKNRETTASIFSHLDPCCALEESDKELSERSVSEKDTTLKNKTYSMPTYQVQVATSKKQKAAEAHRPRSEHVLMTKDGSEIEERERVPVPVKKKLSKYFFVNKYNVLSYEDYL